MVRVLERPVFPSGTGSATYDPRIDLEVEREAEASLERAAALAPAEVGVRRRIVTGAPVRGILRIAEQQGADLIVAGWRRYGPLRRALAGSVSSDLLTEG